MAKTEIPGFHILSNGVSVWRPRSNATHSSTSLLDLIIFCSWLGAAPKHIAKYTEEYKRQFPHAEILLIETDLKTMLRGGGDMRAACSVLVNHLSPPTVEQDHFRTSPSRILWHVSSNGGAVTATTLLRELQHQHQAYKLPVSAARVVLDCSPGKLELSSALRAFSMQLPQSPALLRWLLKCLIYTVTALYILIRYITQHEDLLSRTRRELNDPDLFPREAARLYLYSLTDALVPWADISGHAEEARALGYSSVAEETFKTAQHCRLVAEDGKRYWTAIRKVADA